MTTAIYILACIGGAYVALSLLLLISMAREGRRNTEADRAADKYRREAEARIRALPEEVAAYRGVAMTSSVQRQADEIVEAAWG